MGASPAADGTTAEGGLRPPRRPGALDGIRVLDLSTGIAGPMAAMLLGDFGADVVKVEPPGGDPGRARPGFAMFHRNKRSVVIDADGAEGRARLARLLAAADVCVRGEERPAGTERGAAGGPNPGLVELVVPPYLGETPWCGASESAGLLAALSGMALRQSSSSGGPVDPVWPYVLYVQAVWAAAAAVAALLERSVSGHGQTVTVGGVHASLVAATSVLVIDRAVPEVPAAAGPGGPSALYTRYRCADGRWVFLAGLIPKFQRRALDVLQLGDVLADDRIGGDLERMLLPANRGWIRQRFAATFLSRPGDEWLRLLREAGVPVGPLLERDEWLDSAPIAALGMRVVVDDPERGRVVMPANPVNLTATPAVIDRPAPRLGEHDDELADWQPRPAPSAGPAAGGPPLAGIRVLDLGAILAGPYAGTLLAELGADVVKVEIPEGDSWRDRGMPFIRGQRGFAVDLRSPAGRDAFLGLVRSADLVLDNYRVGVVGRLGIDHEHLREVRPDIISLSITGFGEDSPMAGEPAFDPLLQARSGMMTAQGGDGEPVLLTVPVNDVTTAALAALGSVVSLLHRRRTGEGQRVWIALAATAAFAQSEELVQVRGRPPAVTGGRDFPGPSPLDRSYATRDGWIRLQAPDGVGVHRLRHAGLLPAEGPPGSSHPSDPAAAAGNGVAEQLAAAFATLARDEALRMLRGEGIPAVAARRLDELGDDQELQRWEVFNVLERGPAGPVLLPGRYARFSRSRHHAVLTPPGVGEHTSEVLSEAGMSDPEIAELIAAGAVRQGSPIVYRSFAAYR